MTMRARTTTTRRRRRKTQTTHPQDTGDAEEAELHEAAEEAVEDKGDDDEEVDDLVDVAHVAQRLGEPRRLHLAVLGGRIEGHRWSGLFARIQQFFFGKERNRQKGRTARS